VTMDGLLIRLQALNEVTGKDATLSAARILLFLLFLVIECLPVTVKMMLRPGNYEKVLALAEQHEFRDARGSFNSRSMSRPPTPDSAPPGSGSLWRIWSRQGDSGPQGTTPLPEPGRPYQGPTGTRPQPVDHGDEYGSLEDDVLRRMQDTRTVRFPGAGGERPGGVELLPDDDY
jgi:hypothetical protein